jgi:hypothetical protein
MTPLTSELKEAQSRIMPIALARARDSASIGRNIRNFMGFPNNSNNRAIIRSKIRNKFEDNGI